MVTNDSFLNLLNEIFSELSAATSIMISYSIQPRVSDGPHKSSVKLTGVNGFRLATPFSQHLQSLTAGVLLKKQAVCQGDATLAE